MTSPCTRDEDLVVYAGYGSRSVCSHSWCDIPYISKVLVITVLNIKLIQETIKLAQIVRKASKFHALHTISAIC